MKKAEMVTNIINKYNLNKETTALVGDTISDIDAACQSGIYSIGVSWGFEQDKSSLIKNADYIIYNSTIDGELSTVDQLLSKSSLLEDFKAVKEGNVWCTEQNLFQEPMGLGTMIEDIHTMLTSDKDDTDNMTYMHKLK